MGEDRTPPIPPEAPQLPPRARPPLAFLTVVIVLLAAISVLTWSAAEVYEAVVDSDGVALLDQPTMRLAIDSRTGLLTAAAVAATEAGGRIGIPVLAVLGLTLLTRLRRDWTAPLLLGIALAGSLLLTVVGKDLTHRMRPPRALALPPFETSPSFPSGHTLNATVLAVIVGYLVVITVRRSGWRWLLLGLAVVFPVLVGLSRVYLGQHWLTDVIAGVLLGLAWALSVIVAHRVWLRVREAQRRRHGARAGRGD